MNVFHRSARAVFNLMIVIQTMKVDRVILRKKREQQIAGPRWFMTNREAV
jgi:hypothetical protein